MRPAGIFKRPPYAFHFNEGMSVEELRASSRHYRTVSKADLFDVIADLVRQYDGEYKNVKHIFVEIERRLSILRSNGLR